jgi:hypothetical protein
MWFVLFIWLIWFIWFDPSNQTNQIDQTTVFLCWRAFSASCWGIHRCAAGAIEKRPVSSGPLTGIQPHSYTAPHWDQPYPSSAEPTGAKARLTR